MAITWRNINGPSLADAARPFELARQGLNDSLGQFNKVLDDRIAQRDTAAKEGYMNLLYGASTPEQMAALQQSGQLRSAFAALDSRLQAQVRGEEAKRLAELRTQAEAGFKYGDSVEERNTRDARAAAEAAILRGDPNAAALIQALPTRFQGDQLRAQDTRGQVLVDRERATTRFGREGEKHESDMTAAADRLKTAAAQRGLYGAQAAQAGASTALARLQMNQAKVAAQMDEQERQRAMVRTGLVGENSFYKDFTTPEKNIDAVTKAISGRKLNADQEDNLRTAAGEALYHTYKGSDGKSVQIPVPLSILETAANTASTGNGTWFQLDSTVSKNFTNKVRELMKLHEPEILRDYEALQALKGFNIKNPPAQIRK